MSGHDGIRTLPFSFPVHRMRSLCISLIFGIGAAMPMFSRFASTLLVFLALSSLLANGVQRRRDEKPTRKKRREKIINLTIQFSLAHLSLFKSSPSSTSSPFKTSFVTPAEAPRKSSIKYSILIQIWLGSNRFRSSRHGTCLTTGECSGAGGAAAGNCAAG